MNCRYWSKQTQIAIIENALERYFGLLIDENQICPFPNSVIICDETIEIDYSSKYEGKLYPTCFKSEPALETLIVANSVGNTGFLIWLSSYCFACVIDSGVYGKRKKTKYFVLVCDENCELVKTLV